MMRRDIDLLVIGECNPDLIVRQVPEIRFGQVEGLVESTTLTLGSSGVITACAAARLGLSVTFVGVVGDDLFGRFMRDGLLAHGVDPGLRVRPDAPTGSTVVLERGGDRALLTHLGTIGAVTPADVPPELLSRCRHVHVSSWFLQHGLAHGA
jgi:sugar/nucleoside kinase (ribokinase family)